MTIVLGRLSGQNALWEWRLRGIEQDSGWHNKKLVTSIRLLHENRQPTEDRRNKPTVFEPNWAFHQHRQWWPIAPSAFRGFSAACTRCFLCGV
jgi:hypothetical protein